MKLRALTAGWLACLFAILVSVGFGNARSETIVIRPEEPVPVFGLPTSMDVPVDIDEDGSPDFNFHRQTASQLTLEELTDGRIIITSAGGRTTPLPQGAQIGETLNSEGIEWSERGPISACTQLTEFFCVGEFFGQDAYIGIEFARDGRTHYGWIRFDHFDLDTGGSIIEWAYESTPGVPVYAGLKPVPTEMIPEPIRPGFIRFAWPSQTGSIYQIQFRDGFDDSGWKSLGFALPAAANTTRVDLPISETKRFFRLTEVAD